MGPVSTLGLLLLLVACASCASNENYGINLFKDYLRNGKEYETILNGEIPPKYLCEPSLSALQTEINQIFNLFLRVLRTGSILDFYRASPSLLLPEGGGTKRNQFWRSELLSRWAKLAQALNGCCLQVWAAGRWRRTGRLNSLTLLGIWRWFGPLQHERSSRRETWEKAKIRDQRRHRPRKLSSHGPPSRRVVPMT
ncbi:Hypothetical predicted protein [Cloeon dipterum]|uniref:Uncharacterized protein n=1 Tax=Cloeon dipterum TaxID=197152 RepID=A0A8S1CJ32_9INSE|nr:Hypothetical predicted protein [Cloeon dipterum]